MFEYNSSERWSLPPFLLSQCSKQLWPCFCRQYMSVKADTASAIGQLDRQILSACPLHRWKATEGNNQVDLKKAWLARCTLSGGWLTYLKRNDLLAFRLESVHEHCSIFYNWLYFLANQHQERWLFIATVFIGPRSDLSLRMSASHWLTTLLKIEWNDPCCWNKM